MLFNIFFVSPTLTQCWSGVTTEREGKTKEEEARINIIRAINRENEKVVCIRRKWPIKREIRVGEETTTS